jgi:hypothetical protein
VVELTSDEEPCADDFLGPKRGVREQLTDAEADVEGEQANLPGMEAA